MFLSLFLDFRVFDALFKVKKLLFLLNHGSIVIDIKMDKCIYFKKVFLGGGKMIFMRYFMTF